MDYRKDMRTPKDRVDDELLARLLRETDELIGGCGCEIPSGTRRNSRPQRRNESSSGSNGSCGFKQHNGCGCGESHRENGQNESCGCKDTRREDSCGDHGCINSRSLSVQTQGLPLVMSYCPDHEFHELYEEEDALHEGTLFRELNFPFYGSKCGNKSDRKCGCSD